MLSWFQRCPAGYRRAHTHSASWCRGGARHKTARAHTHPSAVGQNRVIDTALRLLQCRRRRAATRDIRRYLVSLCAGAAPMFWPAYVLTRHGFRRDGSRPRVRSEHAGLPLTQSCAWNRALSPCAAAYHCTRRRCLFSGGAKWPTLLRSYMEGAQRLVLKEGFVGTPEHTSLERALRDADARIPSPWACSTARAVYHSDCSRGCSDAPRDIDVHIRIVLHGVAAALVIRRRGLARARAPLVRAAS